MKYKYLIYILVFSLIIASVNATVSSVVIKLDNQNYNYAVIGRTYDLFVAGSNLAVISNPQLTVIGTPTSDVIQYQFTPGNTAGLRNFGGGDNAFSINVLSEADELANSIGEVIIEVMDNNSTIKINNLDLSNKIIRNFNFNLDEFHGLIDLSNLLGGFTFNLDFVKDQTHPTYNQLIINGGSSAGTVVGSILIFNSLSFTVDDINSNPVLLNQVIDKYNANIQYGFNAKAIKQGNNFEFWSDQGYSNLGGTDLENVQSIINEKIKLIDPDEIVNLLIPIGDFSNFTQFVDFDTSIDFGNLVLEDGTYTLKIKYKDRFGNTGEKSFTVKLDVTNIGNPDTADNTGVVVFTDPVIKQTLERIENLPNGLNVTAVIYGNVRPTSFVSPPGNVKTVLKFMEINADQNVAGSFDLFFKIDKNLISTSDKNNVLLYVEESGSWTVLSTSLINETATMYEYKAVLPHFSNYMLGVIDTSSSSSSGGAGGDSDNPIILPITGGGSTQEPEPTPPPELPETTQPTISPEEAPQGFLAATTAAILNTINQNPLAAVFFGLIALLLGLVVYTLLFYRRKPKIRF